ncbi:MAG TPA: SulP family inorganic anion transporter [Novosphingobium sp.]|nr:SulP family inorganic anion transporter [Novosphingobium sp.]
MPDGTATAHLFRPKLVTALSEGYSLSSLRKDVLAAVTVAIVALPLSMAIAVASGVSPERGLYTAIIGGFLVSALGGSRYQIGGPAGAFIVLVAATTTKFGLNGLLVTVMLSGAMLTLIGLSRLGSLIRHIPHPVTVGFTCGIAVTIFSGEIRDLFGLHLAGAEPGPLIPKLLALGKAAATATPAAAVLGLGSAALIFVLRRYRPNWPGMLIAVVLASIAAAWMQLPAETIGSRFGDIPRGLPTPQAPEMSWALVLQLLPSALSFTLLGGVESLLSAKVADSISGRKHRSTWSWSRRVSPTSSQPCSAGSASPARSREPRRTSGLARSARCRACCMRCSSCSSCSWLRRWRAMYRSRRSPASCWWCAGTWPRRPNSCA